MHSIGGRSEKVTGTVTGHRRGHVIVKTTTHGDLSVEPGKIEAVVPVAKKTPAKKVPAAPPAPSNALQAASVDELREAEADLWRAWNLTKDNEHTKRAGLSAGMTKIEEELKRRGLEPTGNPNYVVPDTPQARLEARIASMERRRTSLNNKPVSGRTQAIRAEKIAEKRRLLQQIDNDLAKARADLAAMDPANRPASVPPPPPVTQVVPTPAAAPLPAATPMPSGAFPHFQRRPAVEGRGQQGWEWTNYPSLGKTAPPGTDLGDGWRMGMYRAGTLRQLGLQDGDFIASKPRNGYGSTVVGVLHVRGKDYYVEEQDGYMRKIGSGSQQLEVAVPYQPKDAPSDTEVAGLSKVGKATYDKMVQQGYDPRESFDAVKAIDEPDDDGKPLVKVGKPGTAPYIAGMTDEEITARIDELDALTENPKITKAALKKVDDELDLLFAEEELRDTADDKKAIARLGYIRGAEHLTTDQITELRARWEKEFEDFPMLARFLDSVEIRDLGMSTNGMYEIAQRRITLNYMRMIGENRTLAPRSWSISQGRPFATLVHEMGHAIAMSAVNRAMLEDLVAEALRDNGWGYYTPGRRDISLSAAGMRAVSEYAGHTVEEFTAEIWAMYRLESPNIPASVKAIGAFMEKELRSGASGQTGSSHSFMWGFDRT